MVRPRPPSPPTERAPRRRYHGAVRYRRVVARFGASPDGSPGPTGALALRRLRRHWGLLAVCAAFLLAGALVLDDYGLSPDEGYQRLIGMAALNYLAGGGEQALDRVFTFHDRYYGAAFEAPLVLVERALGLEDSRDIHLSQHFLTHLFFLAGGVFCYLLVHRMFGNRLLALIAMALFLLHPRLYAHSFFNTKDIPFTATFMIVLYLLHRAFRRDTLAAFLLCGVGVGLLVNLRIMGLILFVAVLALRGLDLLVAGSAEERKHVLLTGVGFALTAILTFYASLPVLWADPVGRFAEWFRTLSNHPNPQFNLFRGEWLYGPDGPPFEYIPVWIGITTPPVVLLLSMIGAGWLLWRGARRPRDVWHGGGLRFGFLLLVLFVAPIIAIFLNGSNIHSGWRHVYFLYVPLMLLAVFGLYGTLSSVRMRWARTGTVVLAGAGVAVMIVSLVRIHPLQASYFNALLDRTTTDYLLSQYNLDHWHMGYWRILKNVVEENNEPVLFTSARRFHAQKHFLPEESRIIRHHPSRSIFSNGFYTDHPVSSKHYIDRIYNNTIYSIFRTSLENRDGEEIIRLALASEPVARSVFTIYLHEKMVVTVKDDCSLEQLRDYFRFQIYPVDASDLSGQDKRNGLELTDVRPGRNVVDANGRCAWVVLLPDYPVANVLVKQVEGMEPLWSARFAVTPPEVDPAALAREPLASGAFDIYRDGDALVYLREPCVDEDIEADFGIDVYPYDSADLPPDRRRDRFDVRTFGLWDHGARVGERCVAVVPLPDYPVAGVRTGQVARTGWRWRVEFAVTPAEVDPAVLAREPLASAVFDIHRDDGALVYVKEGCTGQEAGATFFLHVVPVDVDDLPAHRVQHGFDNLDFELWQRGGRPGGRCVATVALPDYPIASILTGQYDETGQLWAVEFALPDGE